MATLTHWKRHVNTHLLQHPVAAEAVSPDAIEQVCREQGHRWRRSFWSPATTLITFLLQVLQAEKTLRAGVASLIANLAAQGETDLPSEDASAYCQARIRLPGAVVTHIMRCVADRARAFVDHGSDWLGRRVWVVDGSSVSMPDTPDLQAAFPQPTGQRRGCGFPVAQLVVLFCWATGTILDVAIDTIRPHELTLFRRLWDHFRAGDVVLADRAYAAYVDMARLLQRGVFCVFRLHQRRKADFRTGKRLGIGDQLVTWNRPQYWLASFGVSRETFEQLPQTLSVRLVRIAHAPKGFRSRTIVVATTLVDPGEVSADEIRALYRDRWTAELNLRSLKTHLAMDVLRGQSADMVRKEIAMHLIVYNLIRLVMWQAARTHGQDLHRLSFTGTLHRLRLVFPMIVFQASLPGRALLSQHLLAWIASDVVPDRPNRLEPRRRKRRPKQYSLLNRPRSWYRTHNDKHAR